MKTDKTDQTETEEQPAEVPAETPLTPEQLEVAAKETMAALGYGPPVAAPKPGEKPKEPEEPEGEEPAKPKAETETPKAEPPKPKAVKVVKKPKLTEATAINTDELAQKVADKIAPPKPEPKAPAEPELSDDEKRNRAVYEVLAEKKEFKGAVEKYDRFLQAQKDYVAKWEKQNPGETFDPEDEAYQKFLDDNAVCEEEDFNDAKSTLITRNEWNRLEEERTWKENRDKLVKETLEKVEVTQAESEAALIRSLDKDFADMVSIEDLDKKDEIAAYVVSKALPELKALVREAELFCTKNLGYKANGEHPLHLEYMRRVEKAEKELMQLPDEQLEWNGKTFAHISDYNRMTPEQRKSHWSIWLEAEQIKKVLVWEFAHDAKKDIEKIRIYAGKTPGSASKPSQNVETPATRQDATPAPETQPAAQLKKKFPSTAGGTETVQTNPKDMLFSEKEAAQALANMFS